MAHLFVVENGVVKPNTETLLISPFKEIWDRDKTSDKTEAIRDYCFIEFMMSKKLSNPYAGYDDDIRFEKLKEKYYDEDWEPDELIKAGLESIEEFQTSASETYDYYLSVLESAAKMKQFFRTFNMNERSERTGLPIFKPREITGAMADTEKVLQNLQAVKERVQQELFESSKTKGNKQINHFER